MDKKEREQFQREFDATQKQIAGMQQQLRRNPALLNDKTFEEARTKLFYKSYCIDCTLHGVCVVPYGQYLRGE
jgi:hypothetical protein